jgi:hypothetical protein
MVRSMWRFLLDILRGGRKPEAKERLEEELAKALRAVEVADRYFSNATMADFVDDAIYSRLAAQARVRGLLKLIRQEYREQVLIEGR